MHVKHVSNATFYHLSNMSARCHENNLSAKINTVQNTNIFAFCSFTVLNEMKERLIVVWSDFR